MTLNNSSDLATWLAHIEQTRPQHIIDLGLARVSKVGEAAKLLDFSCPVITVAGTNGKGSTVATLATLLQAAGMQVGVYSSPHLFRFNERIQLNGQCVSDEVLCDAFATIEPHVKEEALTFFEYTTLAAFAVFKAATPALDVIILEVGLGGRLDAVNVLAPSMAIFTSISMDHEQILGTTRSAIAKEKAGILRKQIPVILSQQARVDTLEAAINLHENPTWIEGIDFAYVDESFSEWHFDKEVIKLPKFNLPENSVSLALAAYTVFSKKFASLPAIDEVINYIENVTMVGRFQTIQVEGVPVIFDVAHNPASSQRLADKLSKKAGLSNVIAVWASLQDKDLANIVQPMCHHVSHWFIGDLENVTRAATTSLQEQTLKVLGASSVTTSRTLAEAFTAALKQAKAEDHIVVFGSFYTVSGILGNLFNHKAFQHYGMVCGSS